MIDLTKDQQNALDYIVENDWDVFILTGNAGTGKSTLLEIIQKSFKKNKFEVYPGAFTGRAAAVLRQKGLSNSRTIHYYLYGRPTLYVEFKKFFKGSPLGGIIKSFQFLAKEIYSQLYLHHIERILEIFHAEVYLLSIQVVFDIF